MAASTNPDKDIFTTHEVSKLLQVNPRSVINWIEQDLLNSYRTPGGHRRISREVDAKVLWEHAHDNRPEAIHLNRAADNRRVTSEAALPESVAQ